MMRKVLCILLAAVLLPVPYSCSKEGAPRMEGPAAPATAVSDEVELARIEEELRVAPEIAELLRIREEIAARVASKRMSLEWEEAAREEDYEEMSRLCGYSGEEEAIVRARLAALSSSLQARYPVIGRLVARASASPCAPACRAAAGDGFEVPDPHKKEVRPFVCKWGPFAVGLITCAAATVMTHGNPIVFLLCTYQVICANCVGGIADRICI